MTVPPMPTTSRGIAVGIVMLVSAPILLLAALFMLVIGLFGPLGWIYASIASFVAAVGFAISGGLAIVAARRSPWRFSPPPGWPLPPDGFIAHPGWEPDPAWPAAPPNWAWWQR